MKYDFLVPEIRPTGIGKNLYLLGTSEDGPMMQPVYIPSPLHARQIFGSDTKGTLVKAYEQAYDINDGIAIYLMRISGKSATLVIEGFLEEEMPTMGALLLLKTIYGGVKYNGVFVSIVFRDDIYYLSIQTPDGTFSYSLVDYEIIEELTRTINNDCRAGYHKIMTTTEIPNASIDSFINEFLTLYPDGVNLSGGEDGYDLTRDDLYIQCDEAYNLLLGKPIDLLVPVGMYVDDVNPYSLYGDAAYGSAYYASNRDYLQLVDTYNNDKVVSYHEQLIEFCKAQMSLGYMTHGVIGIRPLDSVSSTIEHDNSYILRLVETTAFRDRHGLTDFKNGQWEEKGQYISVFASEFVYNKGTSEEYVDNGAITYAALMAGHFDTTTNMQVSGNLTLRYELEDQVVADLAMIGVVTCRESVRHGLVVANGVTTAFRDHPLHNVANLRMLQLTIAFVNDVVEKFYESDVDPLIRRRLLDERLKETLSGLKKMGVLTGYTYRVEMSPYSETGYLILELQTKYTVDAITTAAEISYTGVM